MASIAKLAVILSAVTKPLEDGLKGAQSKVSSFGKGIKHGAGIGLGVLGLDKIEGAMKKALQDSPELGEAAEKVELSFGKALVHLTAMNQWLPKLSAFMEEAAERFSTDNMSQTFQSDGQRLQSIWMKLTGSSDQEILARVNAMQKEFEEATKAEKAQQFMLDKEKERLKVAKERQEVLGKEAESYIKELERKRDSLDPNGAKEREKGKFKDLEDPFLKARIGLLEMITKELEEQESIISAQVDLWEEGAAVAREFQTPYESMIEKQDRYNDLLLAGVLEWDKYKLAMAKVTPGLKEIEDIQKEIFKLENGELAAKLKDMKEGGASDAVLKQYEKEYNRLEKMKKDQEELAKEDELESKDFADKPEQKFAGAIEAGSAEAYSAAIRAQAGMRDDGMLTVNRNQLQISKEQWEIQKQILKAQGDATKAFEASKPFARMTLGGGN